MIWPPFTGIRENSPRRSPWLKRHWESGKGYLVRNTWTLRIRCATWLSFSAASASGRKPKRKHAKCWTCGASFYALAQVLGREGKAAEAEPVWREGLAVWRKMGDDQSDQRLLMLRGLAETLEHQGKWPEAEDVWRESLPLWRQRRGNEEKESM